MWMVSTSKFEPMVCEFDLSADMVATALNGVVRMSSSPDPARPTPGRALGNLAFSKVYISSETGEMNNYAVPWTFGIIVPVMEDAVRICSQLTCRD